MKRGKKIFIGVLVFLVLMLVAVNGVLIYYMNTPTVKAQRLVKEGLAYMEDEQYRKAGYAFEEAISLDRKNAEVYGYLADAYFAIGKNAEARETIQKGVKATGDESLADRLGYKSWDEAGLSDHEMEWGDSGLLEAMRELTGIESGDIMLSDVWEMTDMNLGEAGIIDISALSELTNLTSLYLYGNNIEDITPLQTLTSLETLSLSDNQIVDIEALSSLTMLVSLDLSYNPIESYEALARLSSLETLDVSGNSISSLESIEDLQNLEYLNLNYNEISDISGLSELTSLTTLYCAYQSDGIYDFSPISELTELERLDIRGNGYIDTEIFDNLKDLEYLDVRGCDFSDVADLPSVDHLEIYY